MALLLALFVMISSSGMESEASVYDFYGHLVNGRIQEAQFTEDRIHAKVKPEGSDGSSTIERFEIIPDQSFTESAQLIKDLLPWKNQLDETRYFHAIDEFRQHLKDGSISVQRAFFVTELGTRKLPGDETEAQSNRKTQYATALITSGNQDSFVLIKPDPQDSSNTLQDLKADLIAAGTKIDNFPLSLEFKTLQVERSNTAMFYLIGTIGPYLLLILIVWFFIIRQMRAPGGSGGVLSFGRSRAALYTKESRTNVTFEDVAGIEEAKDELKEIIEFLKNPAKFAKLGGSIPRGVLLVGSPGTGKTLMAKAIAGEAEVPFFSISGSDFVEMFVGVGASRVRDLFKQARENSPCLVFLDEIDAVGRKRGSGMGGGHDEREQTLNAILVEMDGFDSDKGTILIAATNRPDVLDPALLRPGRFDRQIVIDMPDVKGREDILKVHARKIRLHPKVPMEVIARATPGFSGADLAALINEAAILAAMQGREYVELAQLEEARDRIRWGREKRSRAMREEDLRVTAYHEAGHALVSSLIKDLDPVHKVTIVSRGMALGATMSLPERDDYHMRERKMLGMIAMCYGGRIAEEIVFGDISAGASNDIEQATKIAKAMVCELGMSKKVGPIKYTISQNNDFLGRDFAVAPEVSQATLEVINNEVQRICEEQYARAKEMLADRRKELDLISEGLLEFETLTGEELAAILRGDDLAEYRAARLRGEQAQSSGNKQASKDEPDVGLSGAEGLAHP